MNRQPHLVDADKIAPKLADQLALLESKYPYDLWLVPNYSDDEPPDTKFADLAKDWNAKWRWPEFRTIADLSIPFKEIEARSGAVEVVSPAAGTGVLVFRTPEIPPMGYAVLPLSEGRKKPPSNARARNRRQSRTASTAWRLRRTGRS